MKDTDATEPDARPDSSSDAHTTLALATVTDGALIRVMHRGVAVLVTRVGDEVFAVADTCPHEDVSLSLGSLCEHRLRCPLHGSEFDIRSGAVLSEPAEDNLRRWYVDVGAEHIVLGDEFEPTAPR